MPLSPDEAANTLRDIAQTERHSSAVYGYRTASPYLILWGVIWMLGYGAVSVRPADSVIWIPLIILGCLANFWIGARSKPQGGQKADWRYFATFVAVFAFVCALFAILPPHSSNQLAAFFPILTALLYSIIGIWTRGWRILGAGIALVVLTLGGFFYLPHDFELWMAVVGGGGLILGGFWLRTV